ncbi:Pyridoxine-5'-phosphate oxidase [Armadillidium vulgare]|nr:Pyridoxine-5'-phosphate oxidase [Armadillidium vulgare]
MNVLINIFKSEEKIISKTVNFNMLIFIFPFIWYCYHFRLLIQSKMSSSSYNLGGMRKSYHESHTNFTEDQLITKEPFGQFESWFNEARNTDGIIEANAMCIATASKSGVPSARIVLLKGFSKEGFTFYTNYNSRKGKELLENPKASLCFYWEPLKKSVRIDGDVKKIPEKESEEYFATRPRNSQIAAVVGCNSSKIIPNRDHLNENLNKVNRTGRKLVKPKDWQGGYIVIPNQIEFWQGQTDRTHDRIVFRRREENEVLDPSLTKEGEDGWLIERFAP